MMWHMSYKTCIQIIIKTSATWSNFLYLQEWVSFQIESWKIYDEMLNAYLYEKWIFIVNIITQVNNTNIIFILIWCEEFYGPRVPHRVITLNDMTHIKQKF